MSYKCYDCGAVFDEPISVTVPVNLDGEHGWWRDTCCYCPDCGSEDYKEYDEEDEDGELF